LTASWHQESIAKLKGHKVEKTEKGKHTLSEILNQPTAWEETIKQVKAKADRIKDLFEDVDQVIFTGCGSALNVSYAFAPTFQKFTGIRTGVAPAADINFFPDTVFARDGNTLLVPISRSGSTTEAVAACESARSRDVKTLSITCYPDSQLAQMATQTCVLEAANEKSVTTTQSLTSMVLCGQVISAIVSDRPDYLEQLRSLPTIGRRVLERFQHLGHTIAANEAITKFAFVGNGPFYGLARECQLKIKEMVLLPSDSYPVLDFRHGPKSNVDEHMLITLLMSDSAREEEIRFLEDMKDLGGLILTLCDKADSEIERVTDYLVEIGSGLPEFVRDILYIPPVHFMAYYKSLSRGQDPDNPANLTYWVALEG
jgi:glucosamine--fructose-6-phosphate aminotransferase (isomerizing)